MQRYPPHRIRLKEDQRQRMIRSAELLLSFLANRLQYIWPESRSEDEFWLDVEQSLLSGISVTDLPFISSKILGASI